MGLRPEKGLGLIWPSTTKSGPIKPWAIGHRGQVFHAVSPQRCLLEHPQALQSDEGLRDTPAVDSLILASPLS